MSAEAIFGSQHDFIGRESELERIIAAAHAGTSLSVLAAPGSGASELLRQAYDELFHSESVTPSYFELKRSDRDAAAAAERFAREFLTQAMAFGRRDIGILHAAPTADEISRLADPADGSWIDASLDALDTNADVRTALAIPARADKRVVVLFDGLDRVRQVRDGGQLIDAVAQLDRAGVSVIASGLRRALFGRFSFPMLDLDVPAFDEAVLLIGSIAKVHAVEISDAVRDLIAVQLEANPAAIELLIASAADKGEALTSFAAVERVYTDSIFGGRIARHLRSQLLRPVPQAVDQNQVVRLLGENLRADARRLPMRHWRRSMSDLDDAPFSRLIRHLHVEEVISAGDGTVNMAATSRVIRDFVKARSAVLAAPDKRAITVGRSMLHHTARAPRLMTEFYRSNAAIGVRELLGMFSGQSVAKAVIDYALFKAKFKGQEDAAISDALRATAESLDLPSIIYTADAAAYYPPILELCDRDRAAVGLAESGEAWLVAEIDSKLEADAATADFWCDRMEMAAVNSGIEAYSIWLIAPEGFSDGASAILSERNAHGSSRKQAELLRLLLHSEPATDADAVTNYEITVAMGEAGEMIAARTVGEIAEKHNIPAKTAAQIKTALVEAMINAAEHSLSPDQRIELSFQVTSDTITITVRNRGLKLTNHMLSQIEGPSERRGWGLKLIRDLMDEVRVEPTDDGTMFVMVKRFH
ncbi:MAG: ATP-binding protein [Acidobacteria bacterium]|nr:ATP-binding protein [Acidobacteriota bacterium]